MKKLIKIIIILAIIIALVLGFYKVFIDCEKIDTYFDKTFTLKVMDYAVVEHEAFVKLMKIEDVRCKGDDCLGAGEIRYKLLVKNDMKFSYISLGSVADSKKDIEKLGYTISLEEANEDSATFKLIRMEKKK